MQKIIKNFALGLGMAGLVASTASVASLESDAGTVSRVEISLTESGLHQSCQTDLVTTLYKNGFSVTNDPELVDAVLIVEIEGYDKAIGKGADFRAELQGAADKIIWHFHESERAFSAEGLCEDIADAIVHELEDFRDAIIQY